MRITRDTEADGRGTTVDIRVLGTLDVVDGGSARLALSSPKMRRLLGVLVVEAGTVVSVDRLADAIWGDTPPENATGARERTLSGRAAHR